MNVTVCCCFWPSLLLAPLATGVRARANLGGMAGLLGKDATIW